MTKTTLGRRDALRIGLAGAGAAALGGATLTTTADAAVPTSRRFDLSKPSYELFRSKMLHESHHSMQGFAFDNVNQRLFIVQAQNKTSGDDLCINQVDYTGRVLGSMHLGHAGHGVSIGVESVGTSSYIWMECDADGTTSAARGTALARFKFVNGAVPSPRKFLRGSSVITCATDPVNKRLLVRRKENGAMWLSVYSLAAAAAGNFGTRLAHVKQPSFSGTTFQGYTFYGKYAYLLDGTGQTSPDPAKINSYVTSVDLNTGAVIQRSRTEAGRSLVYREPEGLAVYRHPSGQMRLFMGFSSRSSLSNINRYANLYYKNITV